VRLAWVDLRPGSPRDLADIDVAVPVDREPVGCEKLAELGAGRGVAEAADQLALMVDDADPRPEIGNVAAYCGGRSDFADVANRLMAVGHVHPAWAVQVLPLRLVFTVAVEHLDTVVLAVGDIDPAVRVGADIMDDIEFALAGAGLAPGH